MRVRATIGIVTGALALTALAVPAAQADETQGDTKISGVVVNSGKAVVVGATAAKTFSVSFTVTDPSGLNFAQAVVYHGKDIDHADSGAVATGKDGRASCTKAAAGTYTCKSSFSVEAGWELVNSVAGGWKVWVIAAAKDGDYAQKDNAKSFQVQRLSKLTADATPEPVKKGKTLTVTGKLSRANWESGTYAGYSGQSVKLQFRKKGSSTYSTVKTVKTSSTGTLRTTVKASADGYYRYAFAGTSTTPAVNAAGDFVDVR
jgi:hypothetical protein